MPLVPHACGARCASGLHAPLCRLCHVFGLQAECKFGSRRDGSKVLLLRKKGGKHGPGKWQMPGGSADSKDADALATAEREAEEEVGGVPSHTVLGQVELKRCAPGLSPSFTNPLGCRGKPKAGVLHACTGQHGYLRCGSRKV